jgi:hypothetical protein
MSNSNPQQLVIGNTVDFYLCLSTRSSGYSNPDAVTLSGVTVTSPGLRDIFLKQLQKVFEQILQEHGPDAFKMPKSAAAVHESGHIIVGHSLGYRIKNARLIDHGSDIWGGITHLEQEPVGSKISGREPALRHARMIYAGAVAEAFLPPEVQHAASSTDEVMMSQMLTDTFIADNEDPETCWKREVHHDVVSRLKRNHEAFRQIASTLFKKSRIGGPRLQKMLAPVQISP